MKKEGTLCICISYRPFNANNFVDTNLILCIDNILDYLGGSVIFNKIDLAQGYHQVQIAKGCEYRTF